MKKINLSKMDKSKNPKSNKPKSNNESENYHSLSELDVKVLVREINDSFYSFQKNNNLEKKGKIILSGRNSQHKDLVKLIGKSLNMDVALISPVNTGYLRRLHLILIKLINFLCLDLLLRFNFN